MDITISLAAVTIIGTLAGIAGYLLMRAKFLGELARGKMREAQLADRVYETAALSEIGERIGYSLDASKIIEIISGSLGQLLSYSTVSYMILTETGEKIPFVCTVVESVNRAFVGEVKNKMLAALSEMMQQPMLDIDIDERLAGAILDEAQTSPVKSFFNLPIIISGKVAGLINVSSKNEGLYRGPDTEVLYRIAKQASEAVSRLQEVLESEKGKLSQAVEALADGVLMVDKQYEVIIANKKLCELLSIVENPKIFDIVNALSGNFDIRGKMEEATSSATPMVPWEITIGEKVLQVFVSKVLDRQNDKILGVVVLFHDISDTKTLERLRQDFMAMMVHELRAPLTSIRSTVEMMKAQDPEKLNALEFNKQLAVIDSTSQTMLELVGDLLDVAKVEAGKFDVICDAGDIGEVILDRIETFKAQAEQKGLLIKPEIVKGMPLAWFDKVRMKQVLNNLLSNAIKYTDSGQITVKATHEVVDGNVIDILVSVADTGIGIDGEQKVRLFSKFGQLEAGRSRGKLSSTGLGLYITKKIIEESGGKIWVESKGADLGSTFYFTVLVR